MTKLYATFIVLAATSAVAFADGTVNFGNFPLADYVTFGPPSPSISAPTNAAPVGTYGVELFFASGSSISQPQSAFTLVDAFTSQTGPGNGLGYFEAGTVTISGSLYGGGNVDSGVFEIEGIGLGQYEGCIGFTSEFENFMGNLDLDPPFPPSILTGWNGSLVIATPEPSIIALTGLGAAAMLLFRRKK